MFNRNKSDNKRFNELFSAVEELGTIVANLRRRVMSLEGKSAASHRRSSQDDLVSGKILEEILGGKIIGFVDSGNDSKPNMESPTTTGNDYRS